MYLVYLVWQDTDRERYLLRILKDVAGEDSIVSIDLTIHQPKVNPDTVYYTVCENELPVVWNGYEIRNEYSRVILRPWRVATPSSTSGCISCRPTTLWSMRRLATPSLGMARPTPEAVPTVIRCRVFMVETAPSPSRSI